MVVQNPVDYGKSQSMADAYMGGQKQASNIQYQEAIVNQMKDKQAQAEKEYAFKVETQGAKNYMDSRKQYYDQLIKDPNGQQLIDQATQKDKSYISKNFPLVAPEYQGIQLKVSPKGLVMENTIVVDDKNIESINAVSKGNYALGDRVKVTKDNYGNQKYAKETMTLYQEGSLNAAKKKESDKNFANVDIQWKNRADKIIDKVNNTRLNSPSSLNEGVGAAREEIAKLIQVATSQNYKEEARYLRSKLDDLTKLFSKGGGSSDTVEALKVIMDGK